VKRLLSIILILIFTSNSFAQKEKDSLFNTWHNITLKDSTRFSAMGDLIETHYLFAKTDSALVLGKQMLDLAQKKKNIPFEVEASTLIAKIYFELEEFSRGAEVYTKGLDLAKTLQDSTLYAEKLFRFGYLYAQYDDYTNAYNTLQESEELYRKLEDPLNEGWSIAHQGFIYRDLGDYKESERYHKAHLQLSEKHDIKQSVSGAYGNLGEIYYKMGDVEKSIDHWKTAIRLSKEIGLEEYASVGTGKLLQIYIDEKQYSEAIKYLNEYKTVTDQIAVPKYERNFAMNIHFWQCRIDYGLRNFNKALKECEDCLKIYNTNNWTPDPNVFKNLYEINKELNRHNTALDYFEKYHELTDIEKVARARTEIQSIVFNNQFVTDSINQAEEKRLLNATYQEGIRKKNQEKNLFIIIGVLLIILTTAYFIISRRTADLERKRLKDVNQLKNALFTNITHEFRTPLTVIKGMTDTIKSNLVIKKYDNLDTSLEMIERNSDGLLQLVNEMLDLAKIESGNMELQLVQADIIPFIKYVCESFESYAEENQIDLTIYSEVESLIMDFDTNKLTSVLSNLLSNAVKFTPESGKIIVHVKQQTKNESPSLFIKVKDNGIGIAKDELPNIFSRFYQTDASTVRESEGTGIGLALTKEIVELMDGTIEVNSSLHTGSEFNVIIPITNKARKTEKVEMGKLPQVSRFQTTIPQSHNTILEDSDRPLVLIVEDNLDVAHYLRSCLKDKFETLHASNGIQGIEMALDQVPDIIISDVMMPGKDGFEVCETLKSDERTDHIPIIILTAKASFEDKLKGLSHGADAYLAKPFVKEELFIRLDKLIANRKKLMNKIQVEGSGIILKKRTKDPKLQFLKKIIKLIHNDIGNSNFGSEDLAKSLLVSESQIYRKIKAITGKSTAIYIRSIRLQFAKQVLMNSDKTVSEVAFDVGFNDPSWFSRSFKEEFGYSPSAIPK